VVVLIDVDLGEEGLVAETTVDVVTTGVDISAVLQEIESVVQVGTGVGVFAVVCVEPAFDLIEAPQVLCRSYTGCGSRLRVA